MTTQSMKKLAGTVLLVLTVLGGTFLSIRPQQASVSFEPPSVHADVGPGPDITGPGHGGEATPTPTPAP